eukprot:scaffold34974_cov45-Attheya_sp.AAC.2
MCHRRRPKFSNDDSVSACSLPSVLWRTAKAFSASSRDSEKFPVRKWSMARLLMVRSVSAASSPSVRRCAPSASSNSGRASSWCPIFWCSDARLFMDTRVFASSFPSTCRLTARTSWNSGRAPAGSPAQSCRADARPSAAFKRCQSPTGSVRYNFHRARANPRRTSPVKSCLHIGQTSQRSSSCLAACTRQET